MPPAGTTPPPPPPPTPPQPLDLHPERPKGPINFVFIGIIAVLLAGVVVGVMSFLFHKAEVTVTPHRYSATVDTSFETSTENPILPHKKVSAEDVKTKSVPATGTKDVENRASGTITVYNAFSTRSERLITNTRFETPDGKVYRVHTPIVVPGYTMKAGVKVPGSLDVTVYASEPGESYNIGLADFKLPGLKDSKQAELIYAKSKTPMTGGFVGKQAVVEPGLRAQTVSELKAELDRSLREKLQQNAPSDYLIFPDTISIVYAEGTDTAEENNAIISVSATAYAPAFPQTAFAQALAISGNVTANTPLTVENPASLAVKVTTPDSIGTETPFQVAVSGTAQLVAAISKEQLASDLLGKNKNTVNEVLATYHGIADLLVKVYPFWRNQIPGEVANVTVEIAPAE
jgi:flagellar basal body-associated protein FliL